MENIFQRPPILMRLTMLTRDKMSLLRAASLRTARETAHGLNDRKQRGRVEAHRAQPAQVLAQVSQSRAGRCIPGSGLVSLHARENEISHVRGCRAGPDSIRRENARRLRCV